MGGILVVESFLLGYFYVRSVSSECFWILWGISDVVIVSESGVMFLELFDRFLLIVVLNVVDLVEVEVSWFWGGREGRLGGCRVDVVVM